MWYRHAPRLHVFFFHLFFEFVVQISPCMAERSSTAIEPATWHAHALMLCQAEHMSCAIISAFEQHDQRKMLFDHPRRNSRARRCWTHRPSLLYDIHIAAYSWHPIIACDIIWYFTRNSYTKWCCCSVLLSFTCFTMKVCSLNFMYISTKFIDMSMTFVVSDAACTIMIRIYR